MPTVPKMGFLPATGTYGSQPTAHDERPHQELNERSWYEEGIRRLHPAHQLNNQPAKRHRTTHLGWSSSSGLGRARPSPAVGGKPRLPPTAQPAHPRGLGASSPQRAPARPPQRAPARSAPTRSAQPSPYAPSPTAPAQPAQPAKPPSQPSQPAPPRFFLLRGNFPQNPLFSFNLSAYKPAKNREKSANKFAPCPPTTLSEGSALRASPTLFCKIKKAVMLSRPI